MSSLTDFIEELRQFVVVKETEGRQVVIENRHELGKRITEAQELLGNSYGEKVVSKLASKIKLPERTIYYSIALYKQYPELDLLPAGLNMSFPMICRKLLTAPKEECEHEPIEIVIKKCKKCGIKL